MRCCVGCGTGVLNVMTWRADDLALKRGDTYTKSEIVAIFGSRRDYPRMIMAPYVIPRHLHL